MKQNDTQQAPIPNQSKPVWEMVIEDMRARHELGCKRYGTPLQINNGRDALQDLGEELLDGIVYLKQHTIEQRKLWGEIAKIRNVIASLDSVNEHGFEMVSVNKTTMVHRLDKILASLPASLRGEV